MSGQLIELMIFAGIAFFVINKLIATLGSTSEDDPARKKTFFGEGKRMKDVTETSKKGQGILRPNFKTKKKIDLKGLVITENEEKIMESIQDVMNKFPSFNINNFIRSAKIAFKMIIESGIEENDESLKELIDKRYIEHFKSVASSYGKYIGAKNSLSAHVSEIYMFGNNIFVKILFAGKNITNKVKELHEEWTFTKSVLLLSAAPEWQLTNIDRLQ